MTSREKETSKDPTASPAPRHSAGQCAPGHRAFIDVPELFDYLGAMQFNLLTALGLREHHFLLDIGCGSLRAGKLFIPYLLPGHYYGIEPNRRLLEDGIAHEMGHELVRLKRPVFSYSDDFDLGAFERQFDFILAQSIFTHASSHQIQVCLRAAESVMHRASIFVANFSEGESDYQGSQWVYPSFVQYTFGHLAQLAEEASLRCGTINWTRPPAGQTWIILVKPEYGDLAPLVEPYAQLKALRTCQEQLESCTAQLERIFRKARHVLQSDAPLQRPGAV